MMHELAALIARAEARWTGHSQGTVTTPESPSGSRASAIGRQVPTPLPKTLTAALSKFVADDDLRALLQRAKARHDELPPRAAPMAGTPTLCWPDAHRATARPEFTRPMPSIFEHDERVADWQFWQGHLRKVPMLQRMSCQQILRERIRQKHWRQATAVVIGKWDGQIDVDRPALVTKVARELERTPGRDPREHPAYRVVFLCDAAIRFAGVEQFAALKTGAKP